MMMIRLDLLVMLNGLLPTRMLSGMLGCWRYRCFWWPVVVQQCGSGEMEAEAMAIDSAVGAGYTAALFYSSFSFCSFFFSSLCSLLLSLYSFFFLLVLLSVFFFFFLLFFFFSLPSLLYSRFFFFKWVWDGFDGWGFCRDGFGCKGLRERWFGYYGI